MAITEATAPTVPYYPPIEIAPDTFVVQATQGEGDARVAVHLNAMVIRGCEPMIVDTGFRRCATATWTTCGRSSIPTTSAGCS